MDEIAATLTAGIMIVVTGFVIFLHTTGNAPVLPDAGPGPRALPDKPAAFNRSTVASYAAAYEEARLHNELLEAEGVTRIDAFCLGTVLNVTAVYRVEVRCGYAWEFLEGRTRAVADGAPYTVQYEVSREYMRRFDKRFVTRPANATR